MKIAFPYVGSDCDCNWFSAYLLRIGFYILMVKTNAHAKQFASYKREKWRMAFRRRFEYGLKNHVPRFWKQIKQLQAEG
jgi:hypothetical protein